MIKYILLLCGLMSGIAFAQNYYSQHAVGWHWYDDPKNEKQEKKEKKKGGAGRPFSFSL